MTLYKNGFVVARMDNKKSPYISWPLSDLADDKTAETLTEKAYKTWFKKYNMQQIVPDSEYIRLYLNYCHRIDLPVKVLLFESFDDSFLVDDKLEICEVLGFDCIGTVYYSYLQTEYNEFPELQSKGIFLNEHGLLNHIEDALYFIELRQKSLAEGATLEDFYKELLVKVSVVNIL